MEEWRDVVGYDGEYLVSNIGNVKSLKNGKEKLLSTQPYSYKKKYRRILLWKNGKCKCYGIHRLVATAFLPNPNNYECVNHLDENPSNNCVDNLEWCGFKQNVMYSYSRHTTERLAQLQAARRTQRKSKNEEDYQKEIIQYSLNGDFIKKFDTVRSIPVSLIGTTQRNKVLECCRNKAKTHKGYIWKFAENKTITIS